MVKGTEMAQQEQQVHLSGRLVPRSQALIPVDDRGLTLGDGLFETLAVRNGQALHLEAHLQRLAKSAQQLSIPVPVGDSALKDHLAELLCANSLSEGSLRLTLTRGSGARGLAFPASPQPTLLMTTAASILSPEPAGKRAVVATSTRRNEHSPLSQLKCTGGYLDNILARQEADARGADEALLLNTQGKVACATVGNVFLLGNAGLLTPPVRDGVLPGIARQILLSRLGAKERSVTPEDLQTAEGLLITNSLGATVVTSLEGKDYHESQMQVLAQEAQSLILQHSH